MRKLAQEVAVAIRRQSSKPWVELEELDYGLIADEVGITEAEARCEALQLVCGRERIDDVPARCMQDAYWRLDAAGVMSIGQVRRCSVLDLVRLGLSAQDIAFVVRTLAQLGLSLARVDGRQALPEVDDRPLSPGIRQPIQRDLASG